MKAGQKSLLAGREFGVRVARGTIWLPYTPEDAIYPPDRHQSARHQRDCGLRQSHPAPALELHPEKIALYDQYGGLMPSGWIRWLLEQFEFPFAVVYPQTLDAGKLKDKYDAIIFSDGALTIAGRDGLAGGGGERSRQPKPEDIPAEFRPWLGTITKEKTIPQLAAFAQQGGTVLAIGSSTAIAQSLNLPLTDAPTEIVKGKEQTVPGDRFLHSGLVDAPRRVDNTNPVAYGMPTKTDVFFDRSPAFKPLPNAALLGVKTIAWYGGGDLLDSGWAWGQQYLNNSVAIAEVPGRQGPGRTLRARGYLPGAAALHLQVPLQRHTVWSCDTGYPAVASAPARPTQ